MPKEIEVKARVANKKALLKNLEALGCKLSTPIVQKDSVFLPKGVTYPVPLGTIVLRIRQQGEKILFTLKQPLSNELDCIEHELLISNALQMENIIKLLGFYQAVRIHKTRQKAKFKRYEICVDELKSLGSFIEVEEMSDRDSAQVQEELFSFLKTLGIKPGERVLQGYDTLLYNKIHH